MGLLSFTKICSLFVWAPTLKLFSEFFLETNFKRVIFTAYSMSLTRYITTEAAIIMRLLIPWGLSVLYFWLHLSIPTSVSFQTVTKSKNPLLYPRIA